MVIVYTFISLITDNFDIYMKQFDYSLDYRNLNLRQHPELYRVGRGEQGVLTVEPYKTELLPLWRFKTPDIAKKSAEQIYQKFLEYQTEKDFVGMDMARKFLQMGYTRSRRYANHKSGRKYSQEDKENAPIIAVGNRYKTPRNNLHAVKTKTKKALPQETDALTSEKAQSARIFYAYYERVKTDAAYLAAKKQHRALYEA
jgi:thiamine kinase-like enzyme